MPTEASQLVVIFASGRRWLLVRVTGGGWRGHRLNAPGRPVRPTSERVRLALFNRLGALVPGSRVLDLFAGGGGLGIEALSRGASHVLFVEGDRRVAAVLRDNLRRLGAGSRAQVWQQDVFAALTKLAKAGARFDLILADPPYRHGLAAQMPGAVAAAGLLAPAGVLVVEHDRREELPASAGGLVRTAVRRYGDTCLSYFQPAPADGGPQGTHDDGSGESPS